MAKRAARRQANEIDAWTRSGRETRAIAAALEAWYRDNRRDLPWRRPMRSVQAKAWRTLVSEAMLQQTQVSRAVAYYRRFVARFPTPRALATAEEREVLALWQGLGYYRRARNLQAAAKAIMAGHGGKVPDTVEALMALPGVGRYTAGAIASIAFEKREPLVDGNVARVVSRLDGIDDPAAQAATSRRVWAAAKALVDRSEVPGDLNQALMELGSQVCVPRAPRCERCPVSRRCAARREGTTAVIPTVKTNGARRVIHMAVVPIVRRGRWLLTPRPDRGLWASMWEAPTLESDAPIDAAALEAMLREAFGLRVGNLALRSTFEHQTSHRRIAVTVWAADGVAGRARRGQWVRAEALGEYPMANVQRRIIDADRFT